MIMDRTIKLIFGGIAAFFVLIVGLGVYTTAKGPERAEQSAREYMTAMHPGAEYRIHCRAFGADVRCDVRTEGDKPETIALSCRFAGGCVEARGIFQGGQQ